MGGEAEVNGRCEGANVASFFSSTKYPVALKFTDICYRIKFQSHSVPSSSTGIKRMLGSLKPDQTAPEERTLLNGITGMVSPGEILAILGPSGSGKSTLLNVLAGRIHHTSYTGSVRVNGRPLTKPITRRTGFVTQDDILYPHLTVKETLVFCSLLRLPGSLSKQEKIRIAESVISELGLSKCENTIIGNAFVRGVSGGERKRVSIGHEMLVDPSLLLLDEPTSGLDSTAAYRLVSTLGGLARKGKTMITSMHQPSSRVYQMFDSVLLLSEGRCLYFGKGSDAMDYFASVGFAPSFPMNPADFMLDLANGVMQSESQGDTERPNIKQLLVSSYNNLLAPKIKSCIDADNSPNDKLRNGSPRACEEIKISNSWFIQFTTLLHRSLKERRHEAFNSLRVFQVVAAAVLAGSMWWHSDMRNVHDRLGLLFFISIFWGVFPSFNAVFTFPQERAIFIKERSSGMYTLSSYFVAHLAGDLPMELILPSAFIGVCYWMAGLRPDVGAFLLTWLVLLCYVLVAQGLGLALGAAIMDAKQASTVVTVTMLAFLLTGGFYVHKVPGCMTWMKYTSFTFYCYQLLMQVQYGTREVMALLGCSHRGRPSSVGCGFIDEEVSPLVCITALAIMFVGYRFLAYWGLRRIKL